MLDLHTLLLNVYFHHNSFSCPLLLLLLCSRLLALTLSFDKTRQDKTELPEQWFNWSLNHFSSSRSFPHRSSLLHLFYPSPTYPSHSTFLNSHSPLCHDDRYFSFLEQCKDAKACTVLLRGGSKDVLNEIERNLAVRTCIHMSFSSLS